MNNRDNKKLSFKIEESIVCELGFANLKFGLNTLVDVFKKDYTKYFPAKISTITEALYLTHLGTAMQALKEVDGFEKHVQEYRNDIDSSYFVTVLADYFLPLVDLLELEPSFDLHSKYPDIKIQFNGESIYLECKNPKKNIMDGLMKEQRKMYESLSSVVKQYPCNLTVTYNEVVSEKLLTSLVKTLKERLAHVSGEGSIYYQNGIEVAVTNKGKLSADIGEAYFSFILENSYSERNLINIISVDGIAISFVKRRISVIDNITNQFKKCSKKVPETESLVLAIQSEYLTGHPSENMKIISSLFQPKRFTSISGVLLSNWDYSVENGIENSFIYINNPYARNPVHNFNDLLRAKSQHTQYSKK